MENARDIIRHEKDIAMQAYVNSVVSEKQEVKANRKAEVVRGRKIPKGTILDVFWVGERETYRSRQYSWMNETELIAGCYDRDGNKVWIKAEYLKNVTKIASPNKTERRKFIKRYIDGALKGTNVLAVAMG